MMAYGTCIEPEGWGLANERYTQECPRCGASAEAWYIERVESSSLNVYHGLQCAACDHHEGKTHHDP